MSAGRVVADGPATQIKAAVDVRRVRATLPAADLDRLASLPGVTLAERQARDGGTVADIARLLVLSDGTVRNYLSSAMGKTGARTRAEAVLVAERRGWP
jgi:two-component system, NarL family, response regulator DesR